MKRGDKCTIEVDGKAVDAQFLGKGHYARAYESEGRVYLFIREGTCYGKEILSHCDGPHIPVIRRIESQRRRDGSYDEVWEMPFYANVRAGTEAWGHYKILSAAKDEASRHFYPERKFVEEWGLYHWQRIIDTTRGQIPESLTEDLQTLLNWASNYGHGYCVEFAPRNLGVDAKGRLILRDIILDAAKIAKEIKARRKKVWHGMA